MQKLNPASAGVILDTLRLKEMLAGLSDPRGKIARMLDSGELLPLRRGLYATRRDVDPRCLAASIYGPSYVSFETALAWHGMIPEGVVEIQSACLKRPARFENAFGRFNYVTIPPAVYPIGIMSVRDLDVPFLIATPAKALSDTIARQAGLRSMSDVRHWLEGMRVELDVPLELNELEDCAALYGRPAVRWLAKYWTKHLSFSR